MSDKRIKPALTPEEWEKLARLEYSPGSHHQSVYLGDGDVHVSGSDWGQSPYNATILPTQLRALAALCLQGHFSWGDVDLLRGQTSSDEPHGERLASLADRIAALLAPRKP